MEKMKHKTYNNAINRAYRKTSLNETGRGTQCPETGVVADGDCDGMRGRYSSELNMRLHGDHCQHHEGIQLKLLYWLVMFL